MLAQYQAKQNSIRHVSVQSLDSKFNGNISYFPYTKHNNKQNCHAIACLDLARSSVSTANGLPIGPHVNRCFPQRLDESGGHPGVMSNNSGGDDGRLPLDNDAKVAVAKP